MRELPSEDVAGSLRSGLWAVKFRKYERIISGKGGLAADAIGH
jgi:hypothetical protein